MKDPKTWIIEQLDSLGYTRQGKFKLYKMYSEFLEETKSHWIEETFKKRIREIYREYKDYGELDDDVDEAYIKREVQVQKFRDNNNFLRKTNRQTYRVVNVVQEQLDRIEEIQKKCDFSKFKIKKHKFEKSKYGIMQLSDHHWNEFISDKEVLTNSFNFEIGAKRLKKFAIETINFHKWKGTTDLYLFFTGDSINSPRRIDEIENKITSLTDASQLAVYVYTQMIVELSKHFNIHIAHVVGNESRIDKDMSSSNPLARQNWDYQIYISLKNTFHFHKLEIDFIDSDNPIECLVKFPNGFNAFLVHGHAIKKNYENDVNAFIAKYALERKTEIHAVFSGHRHHTLISERYNQSSSLCGGNSYSEKTLNYNSRAAQNLYCINDDLSYNAYKVDLQNTDGYEGYELLEDLISYAVEKQSSNVLINKYLV